MPPISEKHSNRLIHSGSPYLRQHAHNPTDWYPWGEEAFDKARNENKLVLISVGYSACHWCHVMAHESFEDEAVAEIMNEHFICIKVDREERPDVDAYYMDAVSLLTGRGGWPLNCFALPDGRPVYGGTYFPKQQWIQVLEQLSEGFRTDPRRFEKAASELEKGIKHSALPESSEDEKLLSAEDYLRITENSQKRFDTQHGGFDGVPKFPMPGSLEALLTAYYHSKDQALLQQVLLSLDKMASGGLYDVLEGGFARYSVDAVWKVPHFEKMLYDNAQMLSLYSQAYKLKPKESYKSVIYQTVDFLQKKMMSPEGGFYSAFDADSEGEEGKYYVWTADQIDKVLGDESDLFKHYYSVTEGGNWENGKNILYAASDVEIFASKNGLTPEAWRQQLRRLSDKLLEERSKRPAPALDNKIITAWNALTIKGLVDAYTAFGDAEFLKLAERNAEFILKHLLQAEGSLFRVFYEETSDIPAFADDYALLAEAFLALFEAGGREPYFNKAIELTDFALKHFFDSEQRLFFYSYDHGQNVRQKKYEIQDNVIPSSNSVMAKNLFRLFAFTGNTEYKEISQQMLQCMQPYLESNFQFFYNWHILASYFCFPFKEAVITGSKAEAFSRNLQSRFFPDTLFAFSVENSEIPLLKGRHIENETQIYVCENQTCSRPVNSVGDALEMLKAN
jgi:uncharacterized protein YyaL (SSP411 family)